MSPRSDQYADETYRGEDEHDRYDERSDQSDDRRFTPLPSWGWGGAWGVIPWASRRSEDDYADQPAEATEYRPAEEADGGGGIASYWDEGLITLLIVGGVILFLFPEPVTSGVGVLLLTVGVLAWLVDWAT